MSETQHCPNARLLAGSWMCACHGLEKPKPVRKRKPGPSRASDNPSRPQRTLLTTQQTQEIIQLYSSGVNRKELAKRFHCSTKKIQGILGDRSIRTLSPTEIEEIRGLYTEAGITIKQLATKFDVSREKIRDVVEDLMRPSPSSISVAQQNEIRQAHADGESILSISKRFNKDRRTIYRALGLGPVRGVRSDCESVFVLEGYSYRCHLKTHPSGMHRTTWRDGEDRQFRVEWQQ